MSGPTEGQIENYRRDGFLIVERFLASADLERIREHFTSVFDQTGRPGWRQTRSTTCPA